LEVLYRPYHIQLAEHYFSRKTKAAFLREASVPRGPGGRPVRWPFFHGVYRAHLQAPPAYDLKADAWRSALPDGPLTPYTGACPFCGKPFRGVDANLDVAHTATTRCCQRTIYSHAVDVPSEEAPQPDKSVSFTLRDGRTVTYPAYTVAEGKIFVPACVIAVEIYPKVIDLVIPPLVNRVVVEDNAEAARELAAILDRLAQVATALPYVESKAPLHPAKYGDLPVILPPGYDELSASFSERPPDSLISSEDYQHLVQVLGAGPITSVPSRDRRFVPGFLAARAYWATGVEAWGVIERHSATRKLSREKYGDPKAIADHVLGMMKEINAYARFAPCPGGNFAIGWFPYHVALSVICQDMQHAELVVDRMDSFLINHHFAEGISHEGAFNYAAMMASCYEPWVAKTFFGIDFSERYPWLERLHRLGDYPIRTLANIESQHADEHSAFFSSTRLYPPEVFDYPDHERSQCFPEYGLTCLRAGAPGSRLELIMSHQSPVMHTDPDRLGLQLFYEGVNLLPDIGYMTHRTNMNAVEAQVAESPLRISQVPEKGRYGYNDTVENHCTAVVNGNQFGLRCTTFERYFGGMPASDPRWLVQFAQVDGRPVYEGHIEPVEIYNRQIATINLPGGRPIIFDVFRIQGGRRHDLFWHVPAGPPTSSLPPVALAEANLHQYYGAHADPPPGWRQEEDPFSRFYRLRKWRYKDDTLELLTAPTTREPKPGGTWQTSWTVDPERYAPTLRSGPNEQWQQWSRLFQPVRLRLWGSSGGAPARERILSAVGPWSSYCQGFGGLQFEAAFSYWIEHRQGTQNLASAFVHVIEPHTAAQKPALASVKVLEDDKIDARGAQIVTAAGDTVYVASTLDGGVLKQDGTELNGRFGALMPSAMAAFLYDGTSMHNGQMAVGLEDSWRLRLVGISGDLTGDLKTSSLFVTSERRLPTNGILTGTTITVRHQTNPAHSTGYRIARITALDDSLYQIELADTPGFIQYKYHVASWDPEKPKTVVADKTNLVAPNQPYLVGRRIRFPRSGFETAVAGTEVSGYRAYHHHAWYLADEPVPRQVQKGDPMIVYAIQPGDTVEIPSFFACRPSDDGRSLSVGASGRATLTLHGRLALSHTPPGVEHTYNSAAATTTLRVEPGIHELPMRGSPQTP